ncbi:hypothetical protein F4694_005536 [Bacillus niacini]|uniref:Uncharacterized protein n=1 Tax=Neobacillus niacini TaxID=86668 RepID=A0A852TMG2_9BACI|nr:hypothetical protein [Neobacillus niacini]
MSNYNKEGNNILQKLKSNILICEDTVLRFKKIESPSFICSEHLKLINIFQELITAYSYQLNSINDMSEIINMDLFLNGKNMENGELEKLGPILLSILTKSSNLAFNSNIQL